jgi:hypothetical protein
VSRPALTHPGQCRRPRHCFELHPDVCLTSQSEPPLFSAGQGRAVLTPSFFSSSAEVAAVSAPHYFSPPCHLPSRGVAAPPSRCQALRLAQPLFYRPMPEPKLTSATSASSIEPHRQHCPSCRRSHHHRPLIAVAPKPLPVCATSFFHVELQSLRCSPLSHPKAERLRHPEPTHREPVAFSPTHSSHRAPQPCHPQSLDELPRPPPIDARAQLTVPP